MHGSRRIGVLGRAPELIPDGEERLQVVLGEHLERHQRLRALDAVDVREPLRDHLREMGRSVLQHTYNSLEPAEVAALPSHVRFEGTCYSRLQRKTPQHVWTLFGQIYLRRVGYRPTRTLARSAGR